MREHDVQTSRPNAGIGQAQHVQKTGAAVTANVDPLERFDTHVVDGSGIQSHATTLKRAGEGHSPRLGNSLLRLQRQYGNRYVQRVLALARQEEGDGEVAQELESRIERARGGGQALDAGVRLQMESAFGTDFGGVRIHTGAESHALNRAVSAVAFTTGNDIFFSDGAYEPGGFGGRHLLAHELTHVVQQQGSAIRTKLVVGPVGDEYEQEADRNATAVAHAIENRAIPGSERAAGLVRRQCACGGRVDLGAECSECRKKRESALQGIGLQRMAMGIVQRRVVCPPGVSEEEGTGCYEVADDSSGGAPAPSTDGGAPAPSTDGGAPDASAPGGAPAPAPDGGAPPFGTTVVHTKTFFDYFKNCMDASGLPTPTSLFTTATTALATISAIQKAVATFGTRVTIGELIAAGTLSEVLVDAAALSASFYVGACVGCLAAATAEKLTD